MTQGELLSRQDLRADLPPALQACVTDTFPSHPYLQLLNAIHRQSRRVVDIHTVSRYTLTGALQLPEAIEWARGLMSATTDPAKLEQTTALRRVNQNALTNLARTVPITHFVLRQTIMSLPEHLRAAQLEHFIALNQDETNKIAVRFVDDNDIGVFGAMKEANLVVLPDGAYAEWATITHGADGVISKNEPNLSSPGELFVDPFTQPLYWAVARHMSRVALSPELSNLAFAELMPAGYEATQR